MKASKRRELLSLEICRHTGELSIVPIVELLIDIIFKNFRLISDGSWWQYTGTEIGIQVSFSFLSDLYGCTAVLYSV